MSSDRRELRRKMWVAGTDDTRQVRTYRLLLQRKAPVYTGAQQGPEGVDLGGSQEEQSLIFLIV